MDRDGLGMERAEGCLGFKGFDKSDYHCYSACFSLLFHLTAYCCRNRFFL